MIDDDKRAAAEAAVAEIEAGMLVGLGTGSTAAHAIAALGRRVRGGLSVTAVATSRASADLAHDEGIAVRDFADVSQVDLTIDGADEIDRRCLAIKGAGGAMLREKIVAAASSRMVVIADGSKQVDRLGAVPVPVEVLPFAAAFVTAAVSALGARVAIRERAGARYRTDSDNLVIDAHFARIDDPAGLAAKLSAIPGALGHGLFVDEVDAAYIARDGAVTLLERGSVRR